MSSSVLRVHLPRASEGLLCFGNQPLTGAVIGSQLRSPDADVRGPTGHHVLFHGDAAAFCQIACTPDIGSRQNDRELIESAAGLRHRWCAVSW